MDRRYGAPSLVSTILSWLLLSCLYPVAVGGRVVYAGQAGLLQTVLAACETSSPTVHAGQGVVLTARVEGKTADLVYSFLSSTGKLYANGHTARLDTVGVSPGTTIIATCQVVDPSGRRSSRDVVVKVTESAASQTSTATTATASDKAATDWTQSTSTSASSPSNWSHVGMSGEVKSSTSTGGGHATASVPVATPSEKAPQYAVSRSFPVIMASDKAVADWKQSASASSPSKPGRHADMSIEIKPYTLDESWQANVRKPIGPVSEDAKQVALETSRPIAKSASKAAVEPAPQAEQGGGYTGGVSAVPLHAVEQAKAAEAQTQVSTEKDVYQQAEAVQQWKKQLKNGKIEYLHPTQMKLHETAVVKVVVHGFEDTTGTQLPGAKTDTLKVSPRMQVQLSAEENPGEFDIEPKDGQIQFVPLDGSATWMWKVTPKQPAENQKLTIRALLVYPDNGQQIEQEITSYTATVSVHVFGFWEWVRETFWNDPMAAIKPLLPGGAVFAVIAGFAAWWWKWRHPKETKPVDDSD